MQVEVDATRQQAVDAIQAESVVQFASTIVSTYEQKMNEVQSIVNQLIRA